jgi:type I restriction enzyme R subunit
MPFEFFDPKAETRIAVRNLPHWYQPGVTYFITFRTDDSFPAPISNLWHQRREDWLGRHGVDPLLPDLSARLRGLPEAQQRQFHREFSPQFMEHLDKGHGACILGRPELAQIVANGLHHFDGQRYHLGDYVVMPNHVHLLVCLLGDTDLEEQCYSWKKFTAAAINRQWGRQGRFWHEESFDHLVRNPEQFDNFRKYIADNPLKAGLRPGEYLYWRRPD